MYSYGEKIENNMVSATREVCLKDVQFEYEDPVQLLKKRNPFDRSTYQEIHKCYFGLDTFEHMNALIEKQDFATILKHVWTEVDLDKKLEWLRSVEKIANPILLQELAVAEMEKDDFSKTYLEARIIPLVQLTLARIAQDTLYFNTKNHPDIADVFYKRLVLQIELLSLFLPPLSEYIAGPAFGKIKEEMAKNPENFPAPIWMVPYYKSHVKSDEVTVRRLEKFYHNRAEFGIDQKKIILCANQF
jgi:hypothetical protein